MTIQGPNTNSNQVLTIPDATGTAMVSGNMPAFSAYLSANQTITSGTLTKIAFNTKTFDTANCYDNTTNYRFTPTVAGYYQINLSMGFGSGTITRMLVSVYKNGIEYLRGTDILVSGNNITTSCLIYCNGSTDYIEGWGLLTGVGTIQFVGNQVLTQISGCLMRAA
jgi:hypothetical protein